jgi:hypothetical protein
VRWCGPLDGDSETGQWPYAAAHGEALPAEEHETRRLTSGRPLAVAL